jgi:hypothetical protein
MIFLDFFSSFITVLPENFQFFFFFEKTQNPTENRVFCKMKTETQPKPVLQKPKPNRNLKFSEKSNRNPTRSWVEDTELILQFHFYPSIFKNRLYNFKLFLLQKSLQSTSFGKSF